MLKVGDLVVTKPHGWPDKVVGVVSWVQGGHDGTLANYKVHIRFATAEDFHEIHSWADQCVVVNDLVAEAGVETEPALPKVTLK